MDDKDFAPCHYKSRVDLRGETFGSRARITIELDRGGLTKGECERVVEDLAVLVAAMTKTVRWEHFEFDKMLTSSCNEPWVEAAKAT